MGILGSIPSGDSNHGPAARCPSTVRSERHGHQRCQTAWTEAELLEGDAVAEPLILGGYRCHGGFDADGALPLAPDPLPGPGDRGVAGAAIATQFGTELLDVPLDRWPATYPTVAQSRVPASSRGCASPRSSR